ncbi:MAG: hypothetical protein PHG24_00070 [Candidatus Pacebacteria bacterium]|nr:hypothetical protein [Candidatus Paceibacterota bacterium]
MDKKIVIVLAVILISLIGIIFIISSMFSKKEEIVNEEVPVIEQEVSSLDQVINDVNNLKVIIEGEKINLGGYISAYTNESFLNIIEDLKVLGVSGMRSNIDKENSAFCFYLSKDGLDICIDNNNEGIVNSAFCTETNISCFNGEQIIPEENIPEETVPEENIPEETVVEDRLILKQEVSVSETNLKIYSSSLTGEEKVFINDKEYGPYEESYIVYSELEWGLLLKYNGKWYVNINGKAFGPYIERPVVEAYGEKMGYSYVKDEEYYVFLSGETYGPYQDLTEFSLGE